MISSLPGLASRTHFELLGKPRDSTSILKVLPVNLILKDTQLVFSTLTSQCLLTKADMIGIISVQTAGLLIISVIAVTI